MITLTESNGTLIRIVNSYTVDYWYSDFWRWLQHIYNIGYFNGINYFYIIWYCSNAACIGNIIYYILYYNVNIQTIIQKIRTYSVIIVSKINQLRIEEALHLLSRILHGRYFEFESNDKWFLSIKLYLYCIKKNRFY